MSSTGTINLSNRDIGIVTILYQRMHQIERFQDDFQSADSAPD